MKNNYWKRRDIVERFRLFDQTDEELQRILKKEYRKTYLSVKAELDNLIASLPANPTANDFYKQDRLYYLMDELERRLARLGSFEKSVLNQGLMDYYVNNYKLTGLSLGMSVHVPVSEQRVLKAINNIWVGDGMNFSDRIWTNKKKLLESLREGLLNTTITGNNWQDFSKQLKHDFGVSWSSAKRLVVTEMSHIQNESSLDRYEDAGVKYVEWLAEVDCCGACSEYSGKRFRIDTAPRIPEHPNCRCCFIPVVED